MNPLIFYIGRMNAYILTLKAQGENDVAPVTITGGIAARAVFSFGDYCIDTDNIAHADILSFNNAKTKLILKGGLISNLVVGQYQEAFLTVYDDDNPLGIAWFKIPVIVEPWETCPTAD